MLNLRLANSTLPIEFARGFQLPLDLIQISNALCLDTASGDPGVHQVPDGKSRIELDVTKDVLMVPEHDVEMVSVACELHNCVAALLKWQEAIFAMFWLACHAVFWTQTLREINIPVWLHSLKRDEKL